MVSVSFVVAKKFAVSCMSKRKKHSTTLWHCVVM